MIFIGSIFDPRYVGIVICFLKNHQKLPYYRQLFTKLQMSDDEIHTCLIVRTPVNNSTISSGGSYYYLSHYPGKQHSSITWGWMTWTPDHTEETDSIRFITDAYIKNKKMVFLGDLENYVKGR